MKIAFLSILFLVTHLSIAQLPDSLANKYREQTSFESQATFLLSKSREYSRSYPEINYQLLLEANNLAKSQKSDSFAVDLAINWAIYYSYRSQLDTAELLLTKAMEQAVQLNDRKRMTDLYAEIGNVHYRRADDPKALEHYLKALELVDSTNIRRLASLSNNIGNVYRYLGNEELSFQFLRKSLDYKEAVGDERLLASAYHNIAIFYDERGLSDSALYLFRKSAIIKKKYKNLKGLASSYVSISEIFRKREMFDSSLMYVSRSIAIDRQLNDLQALGEDIFNRAELYLDINQFDQAKRDAIESLPMLNDQRMKKQALKMVAELSSGEESANYWKEYAALTDTVAKADREASLAEMQVKFETKVKDDEIQKLEQEKQIEELSAARSRLMGWLLGGFLVLMILIAVLLFRGNQVKNKSNRLLDAKNQELAKLNQTKDRLFSIISHDLKSPLSSFHTITRSLTDNWDQLDKEQLKNFIVTLRDSSADVKNMMDNLLKWALSQSEQLNYKLVDADPTEIVEDVKSQLSGVSEIRNTTIVTEYKSAAQIKADRDFLQIIIRNLLSNAIKFSKLDSEVKVLVDELEDQHTISIQDYGVGMDQDQVESLFAGEIVAHDIRNSTEKGTGLGLILCKELMDKMGGKIEVITKKSEGTMFKLIFPKAA
ncbi:MAG: tetratricopeptide repeat-containing sensor histidine kinase [Cyclobacteriaceae bacterium]